MRKVFDLRRAFLARHTSGWEDGFQTAEGRIRSLIRELNHCKDELIEAHDRIRRLETRVLSLTRQFRDTAGFEPSSEEPRPENRAGSEDRRGNQDEN